MLDSYEGILSQDEFSALRVVAEDLKTPLLRILSQLELNRINQTNNTIDIETIADATLKLLDSYILSVQTHSNQLKLPLEPISAQAIIYDCQNHLSKLAQLQGVDMVFNFRRGVGLVMANYQALFSITMGLMYSFLYNAVPSTKQPIVLALRRNAEGVGVGIFSNNCDITASSLQKLRQLKGIARQLSPDFMHGSSAGILIADRLCSSQGIELKTARYKKMSGFSFNLLPSRQLALI